MLPTYHGISHGDVPRGKLIHLVISGLHSQYTHAVGRQYNFVPGFSFLRDREEYRSFLSMIDPTAITL